MNEQQRYQALLEPFLNGSATPAQQAEFARLLKDSPERCRDYIEQQFIHVHVEGHPEILADLRPAGSPPAPTKPFPWLAVAAGLTVFLGGFGWAAVKFLTPVPVSETDAVSAVSLPSAAPVAPVAIVTRESEIVSSPAPSVQTSRVAVSEAAFPASVPVAPAADISMSTSSATVVTAANVTQTISPIKGERITMKTQSAVHVAVSAAALATAALVAAPPAVLAETDYTWSPLVSEGYWTNGASWGAADYPVSAKSAQFASATETRVRSDVDIAANGLWFEGAGRVTFALDEGRRLTLASNLMARTASKGVASVTLASGILDLGNKDLAFPYLAGSTGCEFVVASSAASITNINQLMIGGISKQTMVNNRLVITNGGQCTAAYAASGSWINSCSNEYFISGAGSRLKVTENLEIGGAYAPLNQLGVYDGAEVEVDKHIRLGVNNAYAHHNRLIVDSATLKTRMLHSFGSNNKIDITRGGQFTVDYMESTGAADVMVTNLQIHVTSGGILNVNGYFWSGSSTTSDGYGSYGHLLSIDGEGSLFNQTQRNYPIVLRSRENQIEVTDGGRVENKGPLQIGGLDDAVGGNRIRIDGCVWTNQNVVSVGVASPGNSMILENGATMCTRMTEFRLGQSVASSNNWVEISDSTLVMDGYGTYYIGVTGCWNTVLLDHATWSNPNGSILYGSPYASSNTLCVAGGANEVACRALTFSNACALVFSIPAKGYEGGTGVVFRISNLIDLSGITRVSFDMDGWLANHRSKPQTLLTVVGNGILTPSTVLADFAKLAQSVLPKNCTVRVDGQSVILSASHGTIFWFKD